MGGWVPFRKNGQKNRVSSRYSRAGRVHCIWAGSLGDRECERTNNERSVFACSSVHARSVLGLPACRQPEQPRPAEGTPIHLRVSGRPAVLGDPSLEGYGGLWKAMAARASLRMADKTTGDT